MRRVGFLSTAAAVSLCGDWQQLTNGRCTLSNKCCAQNSDPVPSCTSPLSEVSTSIISQETYQFAGDGKYASTLIIATGNSCSDLTYTSGTALFVVDTEGTYINLGNNSNLGNGWEKLKYTPTRFTASIVKSNQANFFTAGTQSGSGTAAITLGPCMKMEDYLNNEDVGCRCNTTAWVPASIPAGNKTSSASRVVNVGACPLVNRTNGTLGSSCPEAFFFNPASRYGSARVTNQTNAQSNTTRLLEITQPLLDNKTGYENSNVYSSFTADFKCPSTIDSSTMAPTAYSAADHVVAMVGFSSVFFLAFML